MTSSTMTAEERALIEAEIEALERRLGIKHEDRVAVPRGENALRTLGMVAACAFVDSGEFNSGSGMVELDGFGFTRPSQLVAAVQVIGLGDAANRLKERLPDAVEVAECEGVGLD